MFLLQANLVINDWSSAISLAENSTLKFANISKSNARISCLGLMSLSPESSQGDGDDVDVDPDATTDDDTVVAVVEAATMTESAWCKSQAMVSPCVLWPNSLVSWKMRAAHKGGNKTRRSLLFTLV